jgi:hypothetical protein
VELSVTRPCRWNEIHGATEPGSTVEVVGDCES